MKRRTSRNGFAARWTSSRSAGARSWPWPALCQRRLCTAISCARTSSCGIAPERPRWSPSTGRRRGRGRRRSTWPSFRARTALPRTRASMRTTRFCSGAASTCRTNRSAVPERWARSSAAWPEFSGRASAWCRIGSTTRCCSWGSTRARWSARWRRRGLVRTVTDLRSGVPPGDELRQPLERMLSARLGTPLTVTEVVRRRADYSSSYATEVVTAHLAGREPVRIFLKNFAVAAWEKDLMPERRSRELCVYRDLLSRAQLGTPAYYGAVWDEGRARYWLLLEHVEGPQVKWCEFEDWLRAAAWLGRLHGRFPPGDEDVTGVGYLVQHDTSYFGDTAARAHAAVAGCDRALGRRLCAATARYYDL